MFLDQLVKCKNILEAYFARGFEGRGGEKSKLKNLKIKVRNLGLFVAVVSLALVLSACKGYQSNTGTGGTTADGTTTGEQVTPTEGGITINATGSGFEPSSATVKSGETITWVNKTSGTVEVGSNNHPTHTLNQEITGGKFTIELSPGESETVTVTKAGSWGYHNHLKPSDGGTVIVE